MYNEIDNLVADLIHQYETCNIRSLELLAKNINCMAKITGSIYLY